MATIATLAVNLSANTGKFAAGMKKAGGSLRNLVGTGAKIAGGAILGAAGAMTVLIKQAIDTGDRVQKLAIATGGSTEFFSEMRQAAELSGTSIEAVGTAMVKLQRRTVKALDGNKAYAAAFKALNIDLEAFKTLSPDQQFNQIADAVSRVEDPMVRMSAVTEILGVGASTLIPLLEGGSAAIDEMREAARKSGQSLSRDQADKLAEVNDAVSLMSGSFQGLANTLAVEFAPAISNALSAITDRLPAVIELFTGLFNIVGKVLGAGLATVVQLLSGNLSGALAIGQALGGDLSEAGAQVSRGAAGIFSSESADEVVSEQQTTNQLLGGISKKLTGQVGTVFE